MSAGEVLSRVFPHWTSQGEPSVTKMASTPPSKAVTTVRPIATGRIVISLSNSPGEMVRRSRKGV
jgi:hypothetical protein